MQHAHEAARAGAATQSLQPAVAAEIEALAAVILPSQDGPGAREAGVIHFIDRALGSFDKHQAGLYREGLEAAQASRRKLFPRSSTIASLSEAQQIELVKSIESTPFFEALRTHTVLGFLGNASYGGNANGAGWAYIGFDDRMAFQPPFGYYDANAEEPAP
jgi:gluconate 2-dehydrogenase gamma chain